MLAPAEDGKLRMGTVTCELQLLLLARPVDGEASLGSHAAPQHLLVGLSLLPGALCVVFWRTAGEGGMETE